WHGPCSVTLKLRTNSPCSHLRAVMRLPRFAALFFGRAWPSGLPCVAAREAGARSRHSARSTAARIPLPMEFRDYYKVLGVERTASADAIRKAYRRLAHKYHPDVSKEANAEARFKEMQEAYEVLKDPEKRAAYDQLGSQWKAGEQFRPPPDWGSGFEFSGDGRARQGRSRGRGAGPRGFGAGEGGGLGEQDFSEFFSSLFGGGSPFAAEGRRPGRDHHARIEIDLEEAFRGTTRMLELKRPELKPDGTLEMRNHTVRVTIPPGVTAGQLIPRAGQGESARERHRSASRSRAVGRRSPASPRGIPAAPAAPRSAAAGRRPPIPPAPRDSRRAAAAWRRRSAPPHRARHLPPTACPRARARAPARRNRRRVRCPGTCCAETGRGR